MFDLLRLPGIRPVDVHRGPRSLVVVAEAADTDPPECPDCRHPMHRHGRRTNSFADTPLEGQPVRIEITRTRYRCDTCGKLVTPELVFLDERRRATRRLVESVRERCVSMSFHALAEQTGLAVNTIKNIAHDLICELDENVHFETPIITGIHEVVLVGEARCVVSNLATNNLRQVLPALTRQHLMVFFSELPDADRIEWVCADMRPAVKEVVNERLPGARLVIDKFHAVRMASDAMQVEIAKSRATLAKNGRPLPKRSIRWLPLKRRSALSPVDQATLGEVQRLRPELALAYEMKEAFYRIYDVSDKGAAIRAFDDWESSLPRVGLAGFRSVAKAVRRRQEDFFAYWDCPTHRTDAYSQCADGLGRLARRIGRGYSFEIVRAKLLYAERARRVGSGVRRAATATTDVEYGPHIPTLVEMAEAGDFD